MAAVVSTQDDPLRGPMSDRQRPARARSSRSRSQSRSTTCENGRRDARRPELCHWSHYRRRMRAASAASDQRKTATHANGAQHREGLLTVAHRIAPVPGGDGGVHRCDDGARGRGPEPHPLDCDDRVADALPDERARTPAARHCPSKRRVRVRRSAFSPTRTPSFLPGFLSLFHNVRPCCGIRQFQTT